LDEKDLAGFDAASNAVICHSAIQHIVVEFEKEIYKVIYHSSYDRGYLNFPTTWHSNNKI
jgi:hypothetical protein